jgi:hypothetical protein
MHPHNFLTTIRQVITLYYPFSITLLVVLFLLLIRIPLGTFNDTSIIDTIGHFTLPATGAPLVYALLVKTSFLPYLKVHAALLIMILLGTTMEAFWEIFEFCIDLIFPWHWQLSNQDTMIDIILAVVGSLIGGLLFYCLYLRRSKVYP